MTEDLTGEIRSESVESRETLTLDRRTLLLTLAKGALALTATGLLAGCGGGGGGGGSSSNSSGSGAGASAQQYSGTLPLPTGQAGVLALTAAPSGQAVGTLVVAAAAPALRARPHTAVVPIPAGVYVVTGTVSPLNLSTTVPGYGLVTLTGTLPTATAAGPVTLTTTTPPQTLTGTLPAGTFSITPSTSTGVAATSGPNTSVVIPNQVMGQNAYRTTLKDASGNQLAYVDSQSGFPTFALAAVPASTFSGLPTGVTLRTVDSSIIILALTGTASTSSFANVVIDYSGSGSVNSYTSDGVQSFVTASNYGVLNNVEAVPIEYVSGALTTLAGAPPLSTVTASATGYGTTVLFGLFA